MPFSLVLSRCQDLFPNHVSGWAVACDDTPCLGKHGLGLRGGKNPALPMGVVARLDSVDIGMRTADALGPGHERGQLGLRTDPPWDRDRDTLHATNPVHSGKHRVST